MQKRLYNVFHLQNSESTQGKELLEKSIFALIGPYNPKLKVDGEIDVYLGVVAPTLWKIGDLSPDLFVLSGTFDDCIISLNQQKTKPPFKSPTTQEFPSVFNFYAIFEITTQPKPSYKVKQLENQLQYVLARYFTRENQTFPPSYISSIEPKKSRMNAYRDFVEKEILTIVCFCGLIMPEDLETKEKTIVNLIERTTHPCVYSLMKQNRFLYLKSKTLSQRLERLEKQSLWERIFKFHKRN